MKNIYVFIILVSNLFSGIVLGQIPDSLSSIFKYYQSSNFKYTVDSSYYTQGVSVERVVYVSTDSFIVSAFITHPQEQVKNHPLMIFSHWGEGDKSEFLEEAISFSGKGFVCIMPDGPWLCPNTPIQSFKRQGFEMYRQCVMNARTAIDLGEQNFKTDPTKIIFAGHSFGCNKGAILSAIDQRIDYFVFMAGAISTTENIAQSKYPDFVEWRTSDPEQFKSWYERIKPLDAERYLPYKSAPCLIQVANNDEYISKEENEAFISTTPSPKEIKKYDCTHSLNDEARKDRMAWVMQQMK